MHDPQQSAYANMLRAAALRPDCGTGDSVCETDTLVELAQLVKKWAAYQTTGVRFPIYAFAITPRTVLGLVPLGVKAYRRWGLKLTDRLHVVAG